ncbi:MAG: (2Fe-2S)-binding protein [Rhodospirillaceae bacterium]|jgi:carbon-monoxide dehydrogenase small subunit|nr:(2Fe-2S)-binding protein [Rhodospirillaceae bacterium]
MEDMLEDTVLVNLRINGRLHELEIPAHKSLLDLLREDLNLTGTHMGCMTGHCGACTVSIDGRVAKSCITLAATLGRAKITTIEGLTQDDGTLSALQQAFWDNAGFQCGYCAPGMLLCTVELLETNPDPSDADIDTALAGNLCRCTGYQSIRRAVKAAITTTKEGAPQAAE